VRNRPPAGYPLRTPSGERLHWVRTSTLLEQCNPFVGCWTELDTPLTTADVQRALRARHLTLGEPYGTSDPTSMSPAAARRLHARKVAWFVRYGFQEPLQLDVGVPEVGCSVRHVIQDGNHRFAAAVYRHWRMSEDPWLPMQVSGSINCAKDLGLW
jgi:hypothetical protein